MGRPPSWTCASPLAVSRAWARRRWREGGLPETCCLPPDACQGYGEWSDMFCSHWYLISGACHMLHIRKKVWHEGKHVGRPSTPDLVERPKQCRRLATGDQHHDCAKNLPIEICEAGKEARIWFYPPFPTPTKCLHWCLLEPKQEVSKQLVSTWAFENQARSIAHWLQVVQAN